MRSDYRRGIVSLSCMVILLHPHLVLAGPAFDQGHSAFMNVLVKHVRDGFVDYASLQKDQTDLQSYLAETAGISKTVFEQWDEAEQIAFLINVYNAQTLKLIVDHYPVKSIKRIGGLLKGPWSQPVVRLWGDVLTLDDIEHEILRARYNEPRIHFALVCAAKGCPPLRAEPFTGQKLDQQLDEQARLFLAQSEKNRFDGTKGVLFLSPIFKWFREDFMVDAESVQEFVSPYVQNGGEIHEAETRIVFTYYDWSLNDLKSEENDGGAG